MRHPAAALPLVLVPALGLSQGGFAPDAWVWAAALAAWACALALVLSGEGGALPREWPWAAAAALLLGWTALSATWSARPAQSILEARRMLVYAACVLALLLLARKAAAGLLAPAAHLAVSALVIYALLRYLLGGRRLDEFEVYTLNQPLGYANAVGILAVLGLLLAVGIVGDGTTRGHRGAAAATAAPLAAALVLSGSTASALALAVGLLAYLLLAVDPLRALAAAGSVAPAAALAALVAWYSRLGVATDTRLGGSAVAVLTAGAALAGALVAVLIGIPRARRTRELRRLIMAAATVAALLAVAVAARSGATEPRASYYGVAWHDQVERRPLLGTGAGTFAHFWAASGRQLDSGGALDAHSLYLETLAEVGPVGLALLLAFLLIPMRRLAAQRRLRYVPAAAGAYVAFLVHAGLDWDWELPAVVVAALCTAAAVATSDVESAPLAPRVRVALLGTAALLGGLAIAGARSDAAPGAARAPQSRALVHVRR